MPASLKTDPRNERDFPDFDSLQRKMIYGNLAPQASQKPAPGWTGFPHCGQKPEVAGGGGGAEFDMGGGGGAWFLDLLDLIKYLMPMPMAKTTINAMKNCRIAIFLLICP